VLTKPLGIGVLASALKQGILAEEEMMVAVRAAARLNAGAERAMQLAGVHSCTDVTGFGLLGHLAEMLDASGGGAMEREEPVGARIEVSSVPLNDRVLELLAAGIYAGGLRNNRSFLAPRVVVRGTDGASGAAASGPPATEEHGAPAADLDDPPVLALFDPQTSGGLLLAVPPERLDTLLDALAAEGERGWPLGEVVPDPDGRIVLDRG
jgi:selenide,water dikinase